MRPARRFLHWQLRNTAPRNLRWLSFAASTLQWLGVCLMIAGPVAPWIVTAPGGPRDYLYVNAFNVYNCRTASVASGCEVTSLSSFIDYGDTKLTDFVNRGLALGGVALALSVGLLIPSALMTSVATYRLSLLERFGVPPYTAGCSLASLTVVQVLAWTGFGLSFIVFISALALCGNVISTSPNFNGDALSSANLPGPVLFGIGLALTLVGVAIVSFIAKLEARILGVGCNRGGCCDIIEEENRGPQKFRDTSPLLSRNRSQAAPVFMTDEER
jgi:hypothetical protein